MAKSVVKINAKGKVVKSYVKWGIIADGIKYGVPITYIASRYEIFTSQDARVELTGWGFLIGLVMWLAFRSKIKLAAENYKKLADTKTNSTLFGVITMSLGGLLALLSFVIWHTVFLLIIFGASSLIADLIFRAKYYSMKNLYDRAIKLQEENDLQEAITFQQIKA